MFESESEDDLLLEESEKRNFSVQKIKNFDLSHFEFRERFRMNENQAEALLQEIGQFLVPKNIKIWTMTPQDKLLLTLRFLSGNSFYYTVGDCHAFSKSSVARAIQSVVKVINRELFQSTVKWPHKAHKNVF